MRILGVDAPRGWSVLDVPLTGRATALANGTLDEGREADELAERIAKWSPEVVVIEAPLEPYIGGRAADAGPGVRRAIVTSLLGVAMLAGGLRERARMAGVRVVVVDAKHVRTALGIRGKGTTELDRNVKAYLLGAVENWPKVSNVDERDAAAACLYAARANGAFGNDGRSSAILVKPNPRKASRRAGRSNPPTI